MLFELYKKIALKLNFILRFYITLVICQELLPEIKYLLKELFLNLVNSTRLFVHRINSTNNKEATTIVVVKNIAISEGSLEFDSGTGQIEHSVAAARHRCDVSSEQCCPCAQLRSKSRRSLHASALYRQRNEDSFAVSLLSNTYRDSRSGISRSDR